MHEIPNDQEVINEAGFLDNADFVLQTTPQFGVILGSRTVAFAEPARAQLSQHHFARFAVGKWIPRISQLAKFELEIAALGDLERVRDRLGKIAEQLAHLARRFQIQFRHVTHPSLIAQIFTGTDAQHHIMRPVMLALEKMHIVRRDEAESKFPRQGRQSAIAFSLLGNAMIVQLDEEILCAENTAVFIDVSLRLRQIVGDERNVHIARQTTTQCDQAARVLPQQVLINARPVIKPIEVRNRDQLHEVAIPLLVARQKGQMAIITIRA